MFASMPSASTSARTLRPVPLANGLVYVNPEMPGLRRVRQGKTFRYKDAKGGWVREPDEISRIRSLAIPPAYEEVWICPLPNGHLQATGLDARGRKQYRYHVGWRALKDEAKFERLEAFGKALPRIRARVERDLAPATARREAPLARELVLATIVRLLDTTYLRVGNEEYASTNGSFGLTTLRNRHAAVSGNALKLRFRGKSGVIHEARVDEPRIAKIVRRCQQLPGQELFQYVGEDGAPHGISSTDVNSYLRSASGDDFTAKDFRTWHGTVQALELTRVACNETPATESARYNAKEILTAVARQLGNTPAVCKKAYVHPAVLELGGRLSADATAIASIWTQLSAKPTRRLQAAEGRLLAFLRQHRLRGPARETSSKPDQPARKAKRTVSRSIATR